VSGCVSPTYKKLIQAKISREITFPKEWGDIKSSVEIFSKSPS